VTDRSMLATERHLTGTAAMAAVATGAMSVSEVVAAGLDRVRECDRELEAFHFINEELARRHAKELDDRVAGRLHGLVVGVKDVIDTVDLPTGYGSPLFEDHQPEADAAVVASLRAASAIVLGKTESTEFAMYQPTRTRNPADLTRTPGGSSSGSAAAVAAGMVPVALGTQTAGSVVRPAAYCGVYGFKPARGWTSTAGIWRLSEYLDTVGIFARSVSDLVLVHGALRGFVARNPGYNRAFARQTRAVRRAAVLPAREWGECSTDVAEGLRHVADRLSDRGWQVSEMAMPASWLRLPEYHLTVMAVETAKNLHAALGARVELISENARSVVESGDACSAQEYLSALQAAEEAATFLEPLSASVDIVLTPSALGVAPEGLDFTGDPVMCRAWTLLGLPTSNVPAYRRADGLPVGVQAVGTNWDDDNYLDHLASLEAALKEE
jgi:Asp-tRNA(Asn)/Glu-tRNA(Gln) amidotransferase A subunit family amidase